MSSNQICLKYFIKSFFSNDCGMSLAESWPKSQRLVIMYMIKHLIVTESSSNLQTSLSLNVFLKWIKEHLPCLSCRRGFRIQCKHIGWELQNMCTIPRIISEMRELSCIQYKAIFLLFACLCVRKHWPFEEIKLYRISFLGVIRVQCSCILCFALLSQPADSKGSKCNSGN